MGLGQSSRRSIENTIPNPATSSRALPKLGSTHVQPVARIAASLQAPQAAILPSEAFECLAKVTSRLPQAWALLPLVTEPVVELLPQQLLEAPEQMQALPSRPEQAPLLAWMMAGYAQHRLPVLPPALGKCCLRLPWRWRLVVVVAGRSRAAASVAPG